MGAESASDDPALGPVLLDAATIAAGVRRLAETLERDYAGKAPVLLGILSGAVVFVADLMRNLSLDLQLEWIQMSSYRDATAPGGVSLLNWTARDLQGRDVILVDEILDTGETLRHALQWARGMNPASLRCCVCFDKPARRRTHLPPDYRAFVIEDHFVVGYGLDFAGRYRNLPGLVVYRGPARA